MPYPARPPAGFTLVEIAIVLIIIGLLLGGILKGLELIAGAKAKNLSSDFKSVPLLVYAYQDKYRALPGDDASAAIHLGERATLAPTAATQGNGRIDGNYNSVSSADESLAFWQQVRLANLATGSTNFSTSSAIASAVPRNAEGGRIGIQSISPITGLSGAFFVCSDGISGRLAKQIDIALDDGDTAGGSFRVMAGGYSGTAQAAIATTGRDGIVDETPYTVCAAF